MVRGCQKWQPLILLKCFIGFMFQGYSGKKHHGFIYLSSKIFGVVYMAVTKYLAGKGMACKKSGDLEKNLVR